MRLNNPFGAKVAQAFSLTLVISENMQYSIPMHLGEWWSYLQKNQHPVLMHLLGY